MSASTTATEASAAAPARVAPASRALALYEWPLVFVIALGALALLRRASLSTPYWWDAAAVYVPGSVWVEQHDFLAVPGIFPSLLGRGHTTLYYVITAIAFRLFGTDPVVGHAVVLLFAAATLVFTYALGTWLYGRAAGAAAAILLAVSPLFLTMSSQALPEVPLMAVTVASLHAFARGRHAEAAAWGVAVILIKETGLACPLAIIGALALWAFRTRSFAHVRAPLAWASVPVLVLFAFFVWQRVAEGWWVLPFHAELFEGERNYLWNGGYTLFTMVAEDGRVVALVVAVAVGLWRWRSGDVYVEDEARRDPRVPPRWVSVAALVLVFLANQVFFTKMWFLDRYALAAHPAVVVLIAGALVPPLASLRTCVASASGTLRPLHGLAALAITGTIAIALSRQYAGEGYDSGETTFRYLHAIEAHQRAFAIIEAHEGTPSVLTTWPMSDELLDPVLGFVERSPAEVHTPGSYFESLEAGEAPRIDLVLSQEGLGRHEALEAEARRLGLTHDERIQVGGAVLHLWSRDYPGTVAAPRGIGVP